MSDYLADVKKYDAKADADAVGKIVKHLGIALRNRDSALVSCSDQKELDRVRTNWCGKKLGVSDDAKTNLAIQKVCETMASDRSKSRVTFYYLVAKHLGKLSAL
jgi:3-dehydroquinate synthetase